MRCSNALSTKVAGNQSSRSPLHRGENKRFQAKSKEEGGVNRRKEHGKKKEAADLLGIDRKTLYRKLEECEKTE
jgi:DNA-binding NtrC family response regulator